MCRRVARPALGLTVRACWPPPGLCCGDRRDADADSVLEKLARHVALSLCFGSVLVAPQDRSVFCGAACLSVLCDAFDGVWRWDRGVRSLLFRLRRRRWASPGPVFWVCEN